MYVLSDFDFHLPVGLIAQTPGKERTHSRLLDATTLSDRTFSDLPDLLNPGDLLIFNDTKVIMARMPGNKKTGGKIEVLIERALDDHTALAKIRASRPPKAGSTLFLADAFDAEVLERQNDFYLLRFEGNVLSLLEQYGHMPLPPYITRKANAEDLLRYQTIFAKEPGATAAPTAGLHFDQALLDRLQSREVNTAAITLHVGAGTFEPVREEDISKHQMHAERYFISEHTSNAVRQARARGAAIIAVGTTSLRALEAAAKNGDIVPGSGETSLFITPGFKFQIVNRLITNFHLPKSSLLMLVSAFAGHELIKKMYAHAIDRQYRFFSYGDAMLLNHEKPAAPNLEKA